MHVYFGNLYTAIVNALTKYMHLSINFIMFFLGIFLCSSPPSLIGLQPSGLHLASNRLSMQCVVHMKVTIIFDLFAAPWIYCYI
jgi:hypothetical protein